VLKNVRKESPELPLFINGEEVHTGLIGKQFMPSDRTVAIASYNKVTPEVLDSAIEGALRAKNDWELLSLEDRAVVFLKAADLLANKYRAEVIASIMLGTGKTVGEAEVDVVHAIDLLRLNIHIAQEIYRCQPIMTVEGAWNKMDYLPLPGFVAAIAPFDFISLEINLACAPLMMGNVVIWKPSEASILGCAKVWRILQEAGLPRGALQLIQGEPRLISQRLLSSPHLGGVNFTGNNVSYREILQTLASNLTALRSYPMLCAATGSNNFHFIHASAVDQLDNVVNQTIRGAFEYSGQKCTSTSRLYVPQSLWPTLKGMLVETAGKLKIGPPEDFTSFTSAIIHEQLFDHLVSTIDLARQSDRVEIIFGGNTDRSKGFYISPTILVTTDPQYPTMAEEVLGPILTVFVYQDSNFLEALQLCESTSKFALSGSIFASERKAIDLASFVLRNSAGSFFINDRTTNFVVGQQPLGGGRLSGTNSKVGHISSLIKWVSPRNVKENFVPLTDVEFACQKK